MLLNTLTSLLLIYPSVITALISTGLVAEWRGITYCHEALEYTFDMRDDYMHVLDKLMHIDCLSNNQETLRGIENAMNDSVMFNLLIANKYYAPSVQAHFQYYNEHTSKCQLTVDDVCVGVELLVSVGPRLTF